MPPPVRTKRRTTLASLVLLQLAILLLLQGACVLRDCRADAIRLTPGRVGGGGGLIVREKMMTSQSQVVASHKKTKQELLHKYFDGRPDTTPTDSSSVLGGSKRTVPSCPDPLHN
ncbi:CLAVATA3/ESR (CLE)-related protein 27 [Rhodamnia argentea]|uniref:CLAVATA3/ESR (CLE)-related protein 27 n=1 Tax=Rhodamnia argentea TaxID=178133 RepID=A0ABM3HJE0_9MYRT|nr:CLAVATA3/ESR (CLE)-related protein 27 [Rhodamnia argentea]